MLTLIWLLQVSCLWAIIRLLIFNNNRKVFLLRQLWIVNYSVKSLSNDLSNDINTGVSVVFNTKRELKMPKCTIFEISFLWKHQFLCFHYRDYLTNF